jgi:hypothetical protein
MFTPIRFCLRHSTFARAVVCFALLLVVALAMVKIVAHRSHAANHNRQQLTFENRVAAQRGIEEVYWRRRIWPKDNPQPKPPLDHVMSDTAIRAKVEDYLRKSSALDIYWQRPITPDELQAEMERMARQSKQPDALGELWAALGNDPLLVAECLARPLLAERMLRMRIAECGSRTRECEPLDSSIPQSASRTPQFDEWWSGVREAMGVEVAAPEFAYRLPEIATVAAPCGSDGWTATSTTGVPSARLLHAAVWTGSEMIIWGGAVRNFPLDDVPLDTGGRYNPATNTWVPTGATGAPSARFNHTAVWTGSEMIVWGGDGRINIYFDTGGRYNRITAIRGVVAHESTSISTQVDDTIQQPTSG